MRGSTGGATLTVFVSIYAATVRDLDGLDVQTNPARQVRATLTSTKLSWALFDCLGFCSRGYEIEPLSPELCHPYHK